MQKTKQARRASLALPVFLVTAVALISFMPGKGKYLLHTTGRFHSWGHLIAFVIVSFVAARISHSRRAKVLLFFSAIFFGLATEFGEHLLYRSPMEWKDVLVDTLGVCCGTLLAIALEPREQAE